MSGKLFFFKFKFFFFFSFFKKYLYFEIKTLNPNVVKALLILSCNKKYVVITKILSFPVVQISVHFYLAVIRKFSLKTYSDLTGCLIGHLLT